MNPQEREVITGIFDRLKQAENNPRDPEAERYIGDLVAKQPYAPYAMAQAVYVQEHAVRELSERSQALEARVRDLEQQLAAQPQQSGGFLSGLFGGGRPDAPPAQRTSVPPAGGQQGYGQPDYQQQPGYPQPGYANQGYQQPPAQGPWGGGGPQARQGGPWGGPQAGPWGGGGQAPGMFGGGGGGGGFLRGALTTAAGVAGGALLFDAAKGMFGGSSSAQAAEGSTPAQTASTSTNDAAQLQDSDFGDPNIQDASLDDSDFGGGDGGGDDWV